MLTKGRIYFWIATFAIAAGSALGVASWLSRPPGPADTVIHNPKALALPHKVLRPILPEKPFPAPSTGTPPAEAILPGKLTDDQRAHRLAADVFLAQAEHIRSKFLDNTKVLQDELSKGQYDLMEAQLNAILAKSRTDPLYEFVEEDAADFAEGDGMLEPSDDGLLDAWEKARPKSPWVHYSRGLRWSDKAWDVRGEGWAEDISDAQWAKVHDYEGHARSEMRKALTLNHDMAIAWVTLLNIDRTDGRYQDSFGDFAAGSKLRPASFLIPDQFEETLTPRWMGNDTAMAALAKQELKKLPDNPRFWELQGEVAADQGCTACNNHNWKASLRKYDQALAYADRPSWLEMAGDAARHLGRYGLAHSFYERGSRYKPQDVQLEIRVTLMDVLCNPTVPEPKLKVLRGFIQDFDKQIASYPRTTGDCTYYQAELPWGDEPIADGGALQPYVIESDLFPPERIGPARVYFEGTTDSVKSQDGKYVVTGVALSAPDKDGNDHKLQLKEISTGTVRDFHAYRGEISVSWTVDGTKLFVDQKAPNSFDTECRVFKVEKLNQPVDPFAIVKIQVSDFGTLLKDNHLYAECGGWLNNHVLIFGIDGLNEKTNAGFNRLYYYDTVSGLVSEYGAQSRNK